MKRIVRLPTLVGGIVMAAVLASFPPAPTSRVEAQVTVSVHRNNSRYYNPYGHGRYGDGRYGHRRFDNRSMLGRSGYGYTGYGFTSYGYGASYGYRSVPYIHSYGGSGYYQPYGQVYRGQIYYGYGAY